MGRVKNYKRDEVILSALGQFWKTGWEATSLAVLEEVTGLNKFSLYAEFKSKRGLYLECLRTYIKQYLQPAFEACPIPIPPQRFLHMAADWLAERPGFGCFLLQGALEAEGRDLELNQLLIDTYGTFEERLGVYWQDGSRASGFLTALRGLMASGRLRLTKEQLHKAVDGFGEVFL